VKKAIERAIRGAVKVVALDLVRKATVEALKGAGYSLVHISDSGEEYSFLKA